ncbi:MAG: hypothetical protein LW716_14765, partial [Microcystis sp. 53602_E8]|nr:hypothetical protein [Microcystis sp. 53602_E8]
IGPLKTGKTPHPTPHTPHPATTEKLFQQTLTRHNRKIMPPSDRIHKHFNLTSTDCQAADGAK